MHSIAAARSISTLVSRRWRPASRRTNRTRSAAEKKPAGGRVQLTEHRKAVRRAGGRPVDPAGLRIQSRVGEIGCRSAGVVSGAAKAAHIAQWRCKSLVLCESSSTTTSATRFRCSSAASWPAWARCLASVLRLIRHAARRADAPRRRPARLQLPRRSVFRRPFRRPISFAAFDSNAQYAPELIAECEQFRARSRYLRQHAVDSASDDLPAGVRETARGSSRGFKTSTAWPRIACWVESCPVIGHLVGQYFIVLDKWSARLQRRDRRDHGAISPRCSRGGASIPRGFT